MRKKSRKRKKRTFLRGGFKHFLSSPLLGEDSHFDEYFSKGLKPPTSCSLFIETLCKVGFNRLFRKVMTKLDQRQILYSNDCRATELQLMEALISSSSPNSKSCWLNMYLIACMYKYTFVYMCFLIYIYML